MAENRYNMDLNIIPSFVRPPAESFEFVAPESVVFHGSGKSRQRFIFSYQVLTEFENEKLRRLEEKLKELKVHPLAFNSKWTRNDLLRFCYGTGWKTRVAVEVLKKYLKWHQTTMPDGYLALYPRISSLFESGCVYVHGRDMYYRPILVINFNRFNFKKVPIQDYIYQISFFLDYVIDNMMNPGKVENWVVITDFEKSGLSDLGFGSVKQVMGVLADYYRCRLGCNYIVNPSKTVYYLWTLVKPFLDEVVIDKMKILNKAQPDEIFSHCSRYQVEEKYGGRAPNVTQFWPPIMPGAPYDLHGEPRCNQIEIEGSEKEKIEIKADKKGKEKRSEGNEGSDDIKGLEAPGFEEPASDNEGRVEGDDGEKIKRKMRRRNKEKKNGQAGDDERVDMEMQKLALDVQEKENSLEGGGGGAVEVEIKGEKKNRRKKRAERIKDRAGSDLEGKVPADLVEKVEAVVGFHSVIEKNEYETAYESDNNCANGIATKFQVSVDSDISKSEMGCGICAMPKPSCNIF